VVAGDGVELHYVERGKGTAVLFVHGTLGDYSAWDAQPGPFAEAYCAVAYSRRYNYPNTNRLRPKHSAAVDHGEDHLLDDALGVLQARLGQAEEQAGLAADTFEVFQ
jgi:pimeloyl-ACP methyl ester carboxylesterase